MRVSYLEIYNEEVRDLLGKDQNMRLEVRPVVSYVEVVDNLRSVRTYSANDSLIYSLNKNKSYSVIRNVQNQMQQFTRAIVYCNNTVDGV